MRLWTVCLMAAAWAWSLSIGPARAAEPHVVFLNPGKWGSDEGWTMSSRFMQAAADQFGMQLEILYAGRDRIRMLEQAREVASRAVPPDYVVLVNEKQQGVEMLRAFQGTPSQLVVMHNDLTKEQRQLVGDERGPLSNWIGTIVTDERGCATAMMSELYRRSSAEPRILGIGGDLATPVTRIREEGVREVMEAAGRGRMLQVVQGDWSRQDGKHKAQALLARYPDANVIWAANDTMAVGAVEAVHEAGRQGAVIVGGLGAFPAALERIAAEDMAVTVGGHMLTGGWAMVLIHDHHRGHDFALAGGPRQMAGTVAVVTDAESAARFRELTEHPERLDYRRLSRADNPALDRYDFSYKTVLEAMR